MPRISVIMAVHNGGAFLGYAIESILQQSERRFEFLIIDDGSQDDSAAIVEGFEDPRIRLIRNANNQGLAASLNAGLEVARGTYIARLDADDIALPGRLALQADFLDRHPNIALLGSNAMLVDVNGRRLQQSDYPCSPLAVRWTSLLQNPFIHSTMMVRRSVLEAFSLRYDARMTATQDYEFWLRCLEHADGANLSVPTVCFRVHDASISRQRADIQRHNTISLTGAAIRQRFQREVVGAEDRASIFDAIFGTRKDAIEAGIDRVHAANRYYDLLEAFLRQSPAGNTAECRRRACVRVVQMVLTPPFPNGAFRLMMRSLKLDVALPLHLTRFLLFRMVQWLKQGAQVSRGHGIAVEGTD